MEIGCHRLLMHRRSLSLVAQLFPNDSVPFRCDSKLPVCTIYEFCSSFFILRLNGSSTAFKH